MSAAQLPGLEELEMLRDTARRAFRGESSLAFLGELGLLGLLTPEEAGGSGWLPIEAAVVAEEAGRALTPIPWVGGLVVAAAAAGHPAWKVHVDAALSGEVAGAIARAGTVTLDAGASTVSGKATIIGADAPGLIVVVDDAHGAMVVAGTDPGVRVTRLDSLDTTRPAALVLFDGASTTVLDGAAADRIGDVATLLVCADALGALSRTATLVREHLVERRAFERAIASFQIIQHRLADLEVLEASVRSLVRRTARAMAMSEPGARRLVSATHAHVAARLPPALDDCIQLSGGIGFTWEWSAHHAMRRVTVGAAMPRLPSALLEALNAGDEAEPALGDDPHRAFRAHARQVIQQHAPFESREGHRAPANDQREAELRAWYRTLYEARLLGASWPVEHGGDPNHDPIHELIVTEELIRARAPRPIDQVQLASHVLLKFGTDEQNDRFLPRIRDGRDIWCQLFSEPDAGSDLAGIKARATRHDDGSWIVSGQKTWTTDAHWAQMGLALLRTSSGESRHAGTTAFIVPMDAPGLVIQPMLTIGGAHEFNDVFLDGVVLDPDSVIGPIGGGWGVAMSGLEVERFGVGGNVVMLDLLLDDLVAVADHLFASSATSLSRDEVQHRIAELFAEAQAAKAFVADQVERSLVDREAPADAAIAKILYSETYNGIASYGARLATAHTPLPQPIAEQGQRLTDAWLWSRAQTISGGSSEIMRNIIAKRRIRLPSG